MKEILKKIAAYLYGVGLKVRHVLFDWNILHSEKFDIPIICVGNITIGGTGKTPTVEMLTEHYSKTYNVAVLSRGYGRVTKGYRVVSVDDHYRQVGDEPLQIKRKFPNVTVVVGEKRVDAVRRIREEFPEVNMVIMDDGFQHRYIKPLVNIVIVDANRPAYRDHLYPVGNLRDTLDSLHRANFFIVTKCPLDIKPVYMREYREYLVEKPSQEIFYSRMQVTPPSPIFAEVEDELAPNTPVIAMSGIGDNVAYAEGLKQRYKVVETLAFGDHHAYRKSDLARIKQALNEHPNAVIMTTEKDAVKLVNSKAIPDEVRRKIYYERISLRFLAEGKQDLFDRIDKEIKNMNNGEYIKGFS
jgi:tetraacyldisaccharide 4'-kinase